MTSDSLDPIERISELADAITARADFATGVNGPVARHPVYLEIAEALRLIADELNAQRKPQ